MPGDLIQTPQTRWILGAYESVQRGDLISLKATTLRDPALYVNSTFRQPHQTTGYQIPNNRSLIITYALFYADTTAFPQRILYADTDQGLNSVVAPTNPIYLTAVSQAFSGFLINPAIYTNYTANLLLIAPAQKYITLQADPGAGALHMHLFGTLI